MTKKHTVVLSVALLTAVAANCTYEESDTNQSTNDLTSGTVVVTLQAENAAIKSGGRGYPTSTSPTAWKFTSNGYIQDTVSFPVAGAHQFVITALGAVCRNVWPTF